MLRRKATKIRATGAKNELVREAYRLESVVTSLPRVGSAEIEETSREIGDATSEIERIDRLTGSLEVGEPTAEKATISTLADAAAAARRRRRRLRAIRRRLLSDQGDLAA